MKQADGDSNMRHTVPVIDRMMDILAALEHQDRGLSIRALTSLLGVPRTTIYRVLNSLQQHNMVWRDDGGAYHLGRRLLALASRVTASVSGIDMASVGQPFLDRLAAELGEGIKLSVIDDQGVLVLAAAPGRREYALTVAPGQRVPVHAGAASKVLLAHLPDKEIDAWLSRPLPRLTATTITDPKRLRRELARVRDRGWAEDQGENGPSVYAYAAPVFSKTGKVEAALSVPFLAGADPERMEEIRLAAIAAAQDMSAALESGDR